MLTRINILAALALALCGCSWSGVSRHAPDGSKLSAWNLRFAWQTTRFELHYATNTASVKLGASSASAETAGAIAEGVARGMK